MFTNTLAAAHDIDDDVRVLILSALHGLVELDTIIEPYDVRMGDTGSVTAATVAAQAEALGLADADVYALLPSAYFTILDEALRTLDVFAANVYEADLGIGFQRSTNRTIRTNQEAAA
jgi:hypothetical protein